MKTRYVVALITAGLIVFGVGGAVLGTTLDAVSTENRAAICRIGQLVATSLEESQQEISPRARRVFVAYLQTVDTLDCEQIVGRLADAPRTREELQKLKRRKGVDADTGPKSPSGQPGPAPSGGGAPGDNPSGPSPPPDPCNIIDAPNVCVGSSLLDLKR